MTTHPPHSEPLRSEPLRPVPSAASVPAQPSPPTETPATPETPAVPEVQPSPETSPSSTSPAAEAPTPDPVSVEPTTPEPTAPPADPEPSKSVGDSSANPTKVRIDTPGATIEIEANEPLAEVVATALRLFHEAGGWPQVNSRAAGFAQAERRETYPVQPSSMPYGPGSYPVQLP